MTKGTERMGIIYNGIYSYGVLMLDWNENCSFFKYVVKAKDISIKTE